MEDTFFARFVFAGSMSLHYLLTNALPGVALGLLLLHTLRQFTKDKTLSQVTVFITRSFAAQFAVAVVSGITLQTDLYQSWSGAGNVVAVLVNHPLGRSAIAGYALITLLLVFIFLKPDITGGIAGTFLYLLIFAGTILLSWWAIVVNSWMHTPAGVNLFYGKHGQLQVGAIRLSEFIFNPSFLYRFLHVYCGSLVQGLLFIGFFLILILLHQHAKSVLLAFKCLVVGVFALLLTQPVIGHLQSVVIANYQPLKLAAFEGYYHAQQPMHYYVWGKTNPQKMETQGVHLPLGVEHKIRAVTKPPTALTRYEKSEWPNVSAAFYAFHIMLLCWAAMLLLLGVSVVLWIIHKTITLHQLWVFSVLLALSAIAPVAGWVASETGRQPWLVYGWLKTSEAHSHGPYWYSDGLTIIANTIFNSGFVVYITTHRLAQV